MAKRKDLLLNESTVSRMMGLAGIGALTNPFLRESGGDYSDGQKRQDQEEELDESNDWVDMYDDEEDYEDQWSEEEIGDYGWKTVDKFSDMDGNIMDDEDHSDDKDPMLGWEEDDRYGSNGDEEDDEEDELEEAKKPCSKCGEIHEGSSCGSSYMQESVRRSMKRLKSLLEQAEAAAEPPAPAAEEMPPEPAPGGVGGDEMEAKIKEFVKKLGDLVQETLGVQVTVEEGEGEPEMPEGEMGAGAAPAAGEEAPAPLAEAINRLVNKVARRVKARLMEAKEDPKAAAAKAKKMKMMKEKQMAAKKKEKEEAAKKKEMEMKKKKAAMAKKK